MHRATLVSRLRDELSMIESDIGANIADFRHSQCTINSYRAEFKVLERKAKRTRADLAAALRAEASEVEE